MRRLMLLRHAKSSWDDEGQSDHERPLNHRGREDAPHIGQELQNTSRVPDHIISSTAKRALQTARALANACGYDGEIDQRRELYLASPSDYLHVVSRLPTSVQLPLLVGHNPGLEQLVSQLSGHSLHLPTSCLVELELPVASWSECRQAKSGKLVAAWAPKKGWFTGDDVDAV